MSEAETPPSRVPSLVTFCQRVLFPHADAISSLGDDIRYDLIKPVLECCSPDALFRLEQTSPCIEKDTSEIWEKLCSKSYPLFIEELLQTESTPPESWRDQFFTFREQESRRLEEAASRLRNQRMAADERKKEREVKLTDRLPPTKRSRTGGWSTFSQPKSLFQKTKNEASKLQRTMYNPPKMIQAKANRVLPSAASAKPPPPPSNIPSTSKVTVKTVTYPRPSISSIPAPDPKPTTLNSTSKRPPISPNKLTSLPPALISPPTPESRAAAAKSPPLPKKNPISSIFMPKHRAFSQLPGQTSATRTPPAR
ncbi:RNA polymerase II transcription factor SIII subunit A-domain-containing protein [Hygrophoropsis aurantiaca]|uniref:RNA polymerase II transcription factor SIII subunit A-domain-containing protein n=1 Tax=Hygrophoropsis aurantiaca TaxID=72124 RepID=A0ACB8ACD6_9AGAM|nr:RNA polymerase II transcription factor SIII subunit A-domain-containing protein [Hygrophoropsis aurantiaca]